MTKKHTMEIRTTATINGHTSTKAVAIYKMPLPNPLQALQDSCANLGIMISCGFDEELNAIPENITCDRDYRAEVNELRQALCDIMGVEMDWRPTEIVRSANTTTILQRDIIKARDTLVRIPKA